MNGNPRLRVVFFRTEAGREPVREWILELDPEDRKTIGGDIKLVQFRWPLGMPLVRKLEADLFEVRSDISAGRIARVMFTVKDDLMVLLHSFIKKSQKTPESDLELGRKRKNQWWGQ